jgi:hypothetical protein
VPTTTPTAVDTQPPSMKQLQHSKAGNKGFRGKRNMGTPECRAPSQAESYSSL